jgi:cell division protease FtsH
MSDRIGPMAWGSQGMVFLGEDIMQSRDYSDETSRVVDEEVERILRSEEERATKLLTKYRAGLEAVARALLEHESIDGDEVKRLVDEANGSPVKSLNGTVAKANGRAPRRAPKTDPAPSRRRPTSR